MIIVFNTTDMVEVVLNAARGEGQGRNFKEHIPEVYSKVHNEYVRVGVYLKETQGLNYRIRFEEHTLQLQVKKPLADQYKILKVWTPKPAINTQIEMEEVDNSDIIKPSEEDTTKIKIILGNIKVDLDKDPKEIPEEILLEMTEDEQRAITEAFTGRMEEKIGNRLTITCGTRKDALLLAKWKGIQSSGTYTQNPLPECFTDVTWNTTHK